jgi:uncharacterized membrane protein YciS (DUF1049 family)
MQGKFTVSLIEIFAYLFPGCVALAALTYRLMPAADLDTLQQRAWFIAAFLAVGFVFGHILTMLSVYVLKLRMFITKKILKQKSRQERLSFYPKLCESLRRLFGSKISPADEYLISLRLVTENMPNSAQEVDRLYALTLFSRNLVLAFLITSLLFITTNMTLSAISLALSVLFLIRYSQLEAATGETVIRSAYVFLCMKEESSHGKSPK